MIAVGALAANDLVRTERQLYPRSPTGWLLFLIGFLVLPLLGAAAARWFRDSLWLVIPTAVGAGVLAEGLFTGIGWSRFAFHIDLAAERPGVQAFGAGVAALFTVVAIGGGLWALSRVARNRARPCR